MTNSNRVTCKGCNGWKNLHINYHGYCDTCWRDLNAYWKEEEEERQDVIGQNGNDGAHYPVGVTAPSILLKAREHMEDRAATYDTQGGERSMAKAARIFNAATGLTLSEEEGWLFMVCLKMARSTQPGHNPDDYEDMSAYSALLGECAGRSK